MYLQSYFIGIIRTLFIVTKRIFIFVTETHYLEQYGEAKLAI